MRGCCAPWPRHPRGQPACPVQKPCANWKVTAPIKYKTAASLARELGDLCGIDARYGATLIQSDEAAVFRAMSRRAKEVIVVADSSKVGMVSPAVVCPPASIDILITDDGIAEEAIDALRRSDVRVVIA